MHQCESMEKHLQELLEAQEAQKRTLYVVSTPIGNLADLSLRASGILKTCDWIACETPQITQKLLAALEITHKKLFTYRDAGELQSAQHLLEKLQQGLSVALVSDAGTPILSDPGFRLVRLCQENQISVVPIPGPSAAITALSVSGLPSDRFIFLGFLPIKKGHRQKILETYRSETATLIIYESPHRIQRLLEELENAYGAERLIYVGRELTKFNETHYRGQLSNVKKTLEAQPTRGEYVLLIAAEGL